jgi:hypothetical protein
MSELFVTLHQKGKLKGLYSINTSPLENAFCASKPSEVCQHCYAQRLSRFRSRVEQRYAENLKLLSSGKIESVPYFAKNSVVRLHSFGELANRVHAENFFEIARQSPDAVFALWTKRPELLEGLAKPRNLVLILSVPELNCTDSVLVEKADKMPVMFDGLYAVGDAEHGYNPCGDDCSCCRKCYTLDTDRFLIKQRLH